uniref:Uncharacterized protein n=1 Tax=Gadus morhua TaxID=8049 RepID=A0A8C5A661_GADMO
MLSAERAVATVKGLWKRGGDKAKALQTYRATPLESDYSPAQLLMGRQIRSDIPQHPATLRPQWPNIKGFRRSEKQAKEDQQRRQDMWLTRERKTVGLWYELLERKNSEKLCTF